MKIDGLLPGSLQEPWASLWASKVFRRVYNYTKHDIYIFKLFVSVYNY